MMRTSSRITLAIAALALLAIYLVPLWRIDLHAPQYPEGLGLRIWVNQITGLKPNDLNSINMLNHYIGMHEISPDDIPELRLMPWLLGGLVGLGLLVAAVGRRGPLVGWLLLLGFGAVAGLVDFWMWGYRYGHELDEHAAIKVPGMSYQPPVIGTKQLLNFEASAWPELGAWIALAVCAVGVWVLLRERRRLVIGAVAALAAACGSPGPRPIALGEEVCRHCHMTIADPRFAAELVTTRGRVYVFDDVGCLAAFVASESVPSTVVHSLWVHDFLHPDSLLDARTASYLRVDSLRTPMSSHLAALAAGAAGDSAHARLGGVRLGWEQLLRERRRG
ncbi:MAG TPA: nitrous oxide reductase accessory protein NosL [Gemmatimonadales bacterium]|nr:nitrous oxide reductase accessory protein NosL [Gemmatimonadales bacterium]